MTKGMRHIAKRYIDPCSGQSEVMVQRGNVDDIIQIIRHADEQSVGATKRFSPFMKGSNELETLRNVWTFVRKNIDYTRDPDDEEVIKTPGCTIAEGSADCKSMSILTGSLVRDLGFQFKYRVAFYDPEQPQQGHIYVIAQIGTKNIVVDPVHHKFNHEITPWKYRDYKPSSVAGIGQTVDIEMDQPTSKDPQLPNPAPGNNLWLILAAAAATLILLND